MVLWDLTEAVVIKKRMILIGDTVLVRVVNQIKCRIDRVLIVRKIMMNKQIRIVIMVE
jgi:hypothetical protein